MSSKLIIREVEEDEARSYLANSACAPPRYVAVDAHSPERAHYVGDNLGLVPTGGNRIEWALNDVGAVEKKYGAELVGVPDEAIAS